MSGGRVNDGQLLNDRVLGCEKSTVFHMDGLSDEV